MSVLFLIFLIAAPVQIFAEQLAIACEQSNLQMSCDRAVIIIQRAIYGREDNTTCRPPGEMNSEKYDPHKCQTLIDMTAVVRYHCQFQQMCDFDVSQIPFDFDCSNVIAYLRVSYNCLPLIGDLPRTTLAAPATTTATNSSDIDTTSTLETTSTTQTTIETATTTPGSGLNASTNSITSIAEAILAEAVVSSGHEALPGDLEKHTTVTMTQETTTFGLPPLYPIMGTNDMTSAWMPCPECELCIQRNGRIKCFFVLQNLTWPEAKLACVEKGGELATVRSDMETRFLNRTKYLLGIHNNNAWIGLRWKDQARAWLWVDDVKIDWELSYTVFAPGEPDNLNGWESCIEFIASDVYRNDLFYYTGYWNDAECQAKRHAICQKYWLLA